MKHRIIHSSHVVAPQLSNNVLFVSSISCCVQNFWWISIAAVDIFTQACMHKCSIFFQKLQFFHRMKHRIIHSSHVAAPQLSNNVLFVPSISCCVQNFWWINIEAVGIFTQACMHECSIFSRNYSFSIKQFYSCSCPKHQGGTGDAGTGGGGCPQPAPEPGHGPLHEAPVPPRRCPGQDSCLFSALYL